MTPEYRLAEDGLQRQNQRHKHTRAPAASPLQDPRDTVAWPAGPWVTWSHLVPLQRLVTPRSTSRLSDGSSQTRVPDPASLTPRPCRGLTCL